MKQKGSYADIVTKGYLEQKLEETKRDIDDSAKGYRDEVLTKLDKVMGELETMREENTIGFSQLNGMQKQVTSHEKRIKKLEQVPQVA